MADEAKTAPVLAFPLMISLIRKTRQPKQRAGERFGRLVVKNVEYRVVGKEDCRRSVATCICDCGKFCDVVVKHLLRGTTKSCGCYQRDWTISKHTTHGLKNHPLYGTWCAMRKRCTKEKDCKYSDYGGRGIYVCERWSNFANFVSDMGNKPSSQHTVDRIDNDGPYSPENCRWATRKEQGRNKRSNVSIEFGGETMLLVDWAARFGVSVSTLREAIQLYGPEAALREAKARSENGARGKRMRNIGHSVNTSKLTEDQVREIKRMLAVGPKAYGTLTGLGKKYNVSCVAIRLIKIGKNWAWLKV